jgi:hypothetical protein
MKNIAFVIALIITVKANAQTVELDFFNTLPKIKKTTLVKTNSINSFNTKKWYAVTNSNILKNVFGIENNKNALEASVANIRVLGWWGLADSKVAFIYAYDTKDNNKTITQVYISTLINNQKGKDINPFEQLPNPTGMKGKTTTSQKIVVNEFGAITISQSHKSSNGKVLSKIQSFFVNEDGALEMTN